jgi:hypothetical protein
MRHEVAGLGTPTRWRGGAVPGSFPIRSGKRRRFNPRFPRQYDLLGTRPGQGGGEAVGRSAGCLSEVTRIDMRGIGCDMRIAAGLGWSGGTVENGSGTMETFATTMMQEARKEGKAGDGRGQRWIAQVGISETKRVHTAASPDRHPVRVLTLAAAGQAMTSCLGLLIRREASGVRNAHPECGGVR